MLFLMLPLMTSCASTVGPATDYCLVAGIITTSSQDTVETKRQILEHNLKYDELCGD